MKTDKNKIVKPTLAAIALTILVYIKFQKWDETNFLDYVVDLGIVILLLSFAGEILLLLAYSPFFIVEKLKECKQSFLKKI